MECTCVFLQHIGIFSLPPGKISCFHMPASKATVQLLVSKMEEWPGYSSLLYWMLKYSPLLSKECHMRWSQLFGSGYKAIQPYGHMGKFYTFFTKNCQNQFGQCLKESFFLESSFTGYANWVTTFGSWLPCWSVWRGLCLFFVIKLSANFYWEIIAGTTRALSILKRGDNAKAERCASLIFDDKKS